MGGGSGASADLESDAVGIKANRKCKTENAKWNSETGIAAKLFVMQFLFSVFYFALRFGRETQRSKVSPVEGSKCCKRVYGWAVCWSS
jgi:hypothetical protein